jgi:LPXTG-site transpeptidase (sortase) family protein
MVRSLLLLVRRVRPLMRRVHPLMQRVWPLVQRASPIVQRARPSAQLLGEVAFGALLVATLAFSPHDAAPSAGYDDAWTAQVVTPYQAASGGQSQFGFTLPGLRNLSNGALTGGKAVSTQALIPTSPPAQLIIPTLNVHRPVEGVGANRSGVMNLPVNAWNAGWYHGGPIPGAPGDAVIEGHAGYPDHPMMFGKLATLRPGDKIFVVLSDGSRRLFLVSSMAVLPVGSAPPGMGQPYGQARLTLVTCTGSFDANNFSYNKRLVVEATYAGIV